MIFFKKEKEVIGLIEKHADAVEECLATATATLQAYLENDIPKAKKLARLKGLVLKTTNKVARTTTVLKRISPLPPRAWYVAQERTWKPQ